MDLTGAEPVPAHHGSRMHQPFSPALAAHERIATDVQSIAGRCPGRASTAATRRSGVLAGRAQPDAPGHVLVVIVVVVLVVYVARSPTQCRAACISAQLADVLEPQRVSQFMGQERLAVLWI